MPSMNMSDAIATPAKRYSRNRRYTAAGEGGRWREGVAKGVAEICARGTPSDGFALRVSRTDAIKLEIHAADYFTDV